MHQQSSSSSSSSSRLPPPQAVGHTFRSISTHSQASASRHDQLTGARNARRIEYSSSYIRCDTGMFAGRTIRAEINEIQKANVGRKYAASKDRRALDPPPVAQLRIFDIEDSDTRQVTEREVDYRDLQPTGLICHIEAFSVPARNEENPSEVTDLPRPTVNVTPAPPTPPGTLPVLAYWRDHPITSASNCTTSLVGDLFTQALNLPIGPNNSNMLLFVFSDVSVQLEGWFLFRYRVFDLFSVSNGSQPIFAEYWGCPFRIYATKRFPGLEPSTELTKLLHSHHVPVRAREERRKRKRGSAPARTESGEDSEELARSESGM